MRLRLRNCGAAADVDCGAPLPSQRQYPQLMRPCAVGGPAGWACTARPFTYSLAGRRGAGRPGDPLGRPDKTVTAAPGHGSRATARAR